MRLDHNSFVGGGGVLSMERSVSRCLGHIDGEVGSPFDLPRYFVQHTEAFGNTPSHAAVLYNETPTVYTQSIV